MIGQELDAKRYLENFERLPQNTHIFLVNVVGFHGDDADDDDGTTTDIADKLKRIVSFILELTFIYLQC